MSYSWGFSALKRSEGGPGVKDTVTAVKKAALAGVTAAKESSPFVGHESIVVKSKTKKGLKQALGIIRRQGLVDMPVADLLAWAEVK